MKTRSLINFCRHEDGQDLVEYSLLIACLALALVGLMTGTHFETKQIFSCINSSMLLADAAAS